MIRRRLNTINFSLRVITFLLPVLAFGLAAYLRFFSGLIPLRTGQVRISDYIGLLFFTTVVWAIVADHYRLFRFDRIHRASSSVRNIFCVCCVTYVAVMSATFFYRSVSYSRLFVTISAAMLFLLSVLAEDGLRALFRSARTHAGSMAQVLIVGADQFAVDTAQTLLKWMPLPTRIAAYVRLPGQQSATAAIPVIDLCDVPQTPWMHNLDDVVLALPTSQFSGIPAIMSQMERLCVPVRVVLDLGKNVSVREILFEFGGLRLLDLRASPSESAVYLVVKRSFDLICSALGTVLLSPLMALVAIAVWLSSPGPVLFVQERVGLNGRLFRMYKFRTMEWGNSTESEIRWTTEDDPRRTPLGSFLRRTNLDELPQLFNVLKGDMSLVGPRPERPHFVEKFLADVAQYNTRHFLKVGMTGWAQVNGWRGDTSIARRVEHDIYYLRNWSLALDLKIICLTLFRSFAANKNAY